MIIIVVIFFLLYRYDADWWWWVLAIGAGIIDLFKYLLNCLHMWTNIEL